MKFMMKHLKTGLHDCLRCINRFSNPEQCTHYHYIYYDDLYEEIQKWIRILAKRVQSGELLKKIQKQTKQNVKTDKLQAEKKKADRRCFDCKSNESTIERIEIGHPVKVDSGKQQEINIVYRFVGTVEFV